MDNKKQQQKKNPAQDKNTQQQRPSSLPAGGNKNIPNKK